MRPNLARVFAVAVVAVVVALALGEVVRALSPAQASAQPGWILAAALLWNLGIAAQGPRWAALMPKHAGSLASAVAVLGTNALTVTLPGPSGEALLAAYSERVLGVPWVVGATAKLLSRLLGLVWLGLMLVLGALVLGGLAEWIPAGLAASALGGGALIVWFGSGQRASAWATSLVRRLPTRWVGPVQALITQLALARAQPLRAWTLASGWSWITTGMMAAGGFTSLRAVGVEVELMTYLWMHVVTSVAGLVAFVIPAGLVAVDALWVGLFVAVGLAAEQGIVAAIAWRQMQAFALLMSLPALLSVSRQTVKGTPA